MEKLILPEGIKYSCQTCGLCCRTDWEIRITKEAYTHLMAYNWEEVLGKQPPFKEIVHKERAMYRFIPVDGKCVFLNKENRCLVHSLLGYEAKGEVCKQFPYLPRRVPEGVIVGLSFACPAVVKGLGLSVQDRTEEIRRVILEMPEVPNSPSMMVFQGRSKFGREDFLELKRKLMEILEDENLSALEERLLKGHSFLRRLSPRWKRREKWGLEKMEEAQEEQERSYAKPLFQKRRVKYILAFIISLQESVLRTPSKLLRLIFTALGLVKLSSKRGSFFFPSLNQTIDLRLEEKIQFDPDQPQLKEPLLRYLNHCLFRESLFCTFGIRWGFQFLLLYYLLLLSYAKFHTLSDKRTAVGREDVERAIRLIERKYNIEHNRFSRSLFRLPGLKLCLALIAS